MAPTQTQTSQDQTGQVVNTTMNTTAHLVNLRLDNLLSVVSSPSTGDSVIDQSLDQIRKDLESLTSAQSSEQEEIKKLLEEALNNEVLQHLTNQIEHQIDTSIDNTVKELVEGELDKYVPREIRNQVDKQRSDMLVLQVKIHNSEAKRANSFVKTRKHFNETLQPILGHTGRPSDIFPKTVNELLKFDDAKVLQIVKFYGMEGSDVRSKILNLNWFLRQIGVTYQSDLLG